MRKVYLLKEYESNQPGDIIQVGNIIAFGLIDSGIARVTTNRDFIVKPEFGMSRAFKTAPNRAYKRRK